jgi:hydrogenase/urease accessory protein HupE
VTMAHRARGDTGLYLWLARVGGVANLRMRRRIRPLACLAVAISSPAWAHNIPTEQQRALASGGYLDYAWSGAVHMLTGYDHLLFLFGVMFFLTKFRDIVTFVTAFTIGHSVTLLGATLLGIRANHYLIDAVPGR